jgi:hypothetical protein
MLVISKLFIEGVHAVCLAYACMKNSVRQRAQDKRGDLLRQMIREDLIAARGCVKRQRGEARQEGRYVK